MNIEISFWDAYLIEQAIKEQAQQLEWEDEDRGKKRNEEKIKDLRRLAEYLHNEQVRFMQH